MFSEDRAAFIASLDEYDLLIIDDLGVERSTDYAMEQMFFVIDSRYRSRRPMIITTNLKLSELKNPPDLAHARIYDRILERCAPILFDGKNFRGKTPVPLKAAAKDLVNRKVSNFVTGGNPARRKERHERRNPYHADHRPRPGQSAGGCPALVKENRQNHLCRECPFQ